MKKGGPWTWAGEGPIRQASAARASRGRFKAEVETPMRPRVPSIPRRVGSMPIAVSRIALSVFGIGFKSLCFVPKRVHFSEAGGAKWLSLPRQLGFDEAEPPLEFRMGLA